MSQVGQRRLSAGPEEGPLRRVDPRVAAKQDYEMGLSGRTIGAKYGVSEGAVRKWAREGGWKKPPRKGWGAVDLVAPATASPQGPTLPKESEASLTPTSPISGIDQGEGDVVGATDADAGTQTSAESTQSGTQSGTQSDSSRTDVSTNAVQGDHQPLVLQFQQRVRDLLSNPSPNEAADVAARAVVEVVRGHRRCISRAQGLVDRLLDQLDVAMGSRDLLEEFILAETEPGKYRSMLMKLISLSSHAGTMRDLATAMERLTKLDRQAFGLVESDDPTPPPAPSTHEEPVDEQFALLRTKFARLGAPQVPEVLDVNAKATDVQQSLNGG